MAWFTTDWFSSHHTVRCSHKSDDVINFITLACRISSRLKWYKNYKIRLRFAKVIVKNKMSRFFMVQCVYYFMTYFRALISSIVSRMRWRVITHCRQFVCSELTYQSIARTADRPIDASWKLRYTRCRWACATVFATKNALELFIHLRISSKSVNARFTTWKPVKCHSALYGVEACPVLVRDKQIRIHDHSLTYEIISYGDLQTW